MHSQTKIKIVMSERKKVTKVNINSVILEIIRLPLQIIL